MQRKFKGLWIAAELWLCADLTKQEVCFLAEIDSLDVEGKGCYASNEYLATFFDLSVNRTRAIIGKLSRDGWLRVECERTTKGTERRMYGGARFLGLQGGVSENKHPLGNKAPGELESKQGGCPNTGGAYIGENKEREQSKEGQTEVLLFDVPSTGEKKQSKAVIARLEREAWAEILLAEYPKTGRNVKRDKASITRALRNHPFETLRAKVREYAQAKKGTEAKYIAEPHNFFDKERFLEDFTVEAYVKSGAPTFPTSGSKHTMSAEERRAARGIEE